MASLTTGRVRSGHRCHKKLYLESHARELAVPAAPVIDRREAYARIDALARARFSGGIAIDRMVESAARTRDLLADSTVPAIFGASFTRDRVQIRADVLARAGAGFELFSVTAGTRVRERHARDLALQLWVLAAHEVTITRVWLFALDRDYVYPGGAVDPACLFFREDLTDQARALVSDLGAEIATMQVVLAGEQPPPVPTGGQCLRPRCDFYDHCHAGEPAHPLAELPRLDPAQLEALQARGIRTVPDVPEDFPSLTPLQARACAAVRSGRPFRDPAIAEALAIIVWPAHCIDFETFSVPVPIYPGTRPYENIPFQWSNHVLTAAGALDHREYLHDGDGDPRRAFAESLLAATEGPGSALSYSSFEADVLEALATELPDLASGLRALAARIVDLLPIVRAHCYHPDFRGSFSLKRVLPALVPDLGYDDLAIRHGLVASAAHDELVDRATSPQRRAVLRADLLAYCGRDTLALVELYRTLSGARSG